MNILFTCHNHPYDAFRGNPRGGELSVRIIMHDLKGKGYNVKAWHMTAADAQIEGINFHGGHGRMKRLVKNWADVVITWGDAAPMTADECVKQGKPYILMVRWWRNVHPTPAIGDLRAKLPPESFRRRKQFLFDHAHAIVTNNHYAASVIERIYNRGDVQVSYVPVVGESERIGKKNGTITLVTPSKELGEYQLVKQLTKLLHNEDFLIVNAGKLASRFRALRNVDAIGYREEMRDVWKRSKIILYPVYHNDVCGCSRVTVEAMQHGVVPVVNARSGMEEIQPSHNVVSYNAPAQEWADKICEITADFGARQAEVVQKFNNYNTQAQLLVFERAIRRAVKVTA